jgi:hypothetical protein
MALLRCGISIRPRSAPGPRRDQSSQWIKAHPLVSLTSGSGPSKCARDGGPPLRLLVATALRKNSITRTSAFIAANASRSSSRHRRRSDAVAGYVTKAFIAVRSYGCQGAQEALSHALVDADRVRRTIGVALEPDGQQLQVGARVGVQRGRPIDLGTKDCGQFHRKNSPIVARYRRVFFS